MKDALDTRSGLPDALRVLLDEYPREAWQAHDNFGSLIQFWLERHLMFRKLMTTMTDETERALNGELEARMLGMRLSRYGSLFVGELHGHHTVEDTHYFPKIKTLEVNLERGFDILDRDHKDLDGHLELFANDANSLLSKISADSEWRSECEAMRKGLKRLERFLERHLTDEEELVVPVLLKHAPEEMI